MCENEILPLFEKLNNYNNINNNNIYIFDTCLIHLDLHFDHFMIVNKKINGIIADLALEFQKIWSIDQTMCHKLIEKYSNYRKYQLSPFFNIRIDLYGFIHTLYKIFYCYQNHNLKENLIII